MNYLDFVLRTAGSHHCISQQNNTVDSQADQQINWSCRSCSNRLMDSAILRSYVYLSFLNNPEYFHIVLEENRKGDKDVLWEFHNRGVSWGCWYGSMFSLCVSYTGPFINELIDRIVRQTADELSDSRGKMWQNLQMIVIVELVWLKNLMM